jgi:hypothetical protein
VKDLDVPKGTGVQVTAVAKVLDIDKTSALRRVRVAIEDGYLINLEERKGRPARLTLGDPLPAERSVLPSPEQLTEGGTLAWVSPPATVLPRNRSDVAQIAALRNKAAVELGPGQQDSSDVAQNAVLRSEEGAELELWQQSAWEEGDL